MKASLLFYTLLWITINFPNEVTPLPQEHPLPDDLPLDAQPKTYEAECKCADGSQCDGTCSCSCTSGTCIAGIDGFISVIVHDLHWNHCGPCPDGSTCQGLKSCHCDVETGSCIAFNDCEPQTDTTADVPVTDTTTDIPVTDTTTDIPVTDTTTDIPVTDTTADVTDTDTTTEDFCEYCWKYCCGAKTKTLDVDCQECLWASCCDDFPGTRFSFFAK